MTMKGDGVTETGGGKLPAGETFGERPGNIYREECQAPSSSDHF